MAKNVGVNVGYEVKGKTLTITVDLSKTNGKSKSGKTVTIASTRGNTKIQDDKGNEVIFGLNVYKYDEPKDEE